MICKISTKEIKLNRYILIARSFKNSAELFILNNVVERWFFNCRYINLNFDKVMEKLKMIMKLMVPLKMEN